MASLSDDDGWVDFDFNENTDELSDLFDATALGSNYAVNEQDYRWWVVHEFERRGWRVEAVYLGNPMRHDEKYLLINQGFA